MTLEQPNQTLRVVCVADEPDRRLLRFVASLAQASALQPDLVVVTSNLRHPLLEPVRARGARLIEAGRGLSYGARVNLGVGDLGTDWLAIARADIEWRPGSIDRLIAAAQTDPRVGAVGPRLLRPDGRVHPSAHRSARALAHLALGLGPVLASRVQRGQPRPPHRLDLAPTETARGVGWLSSCCLLLRPAAFAAVGGFNENYSHFFEDGDLAERLESEGWSSLYLPAAEASFTPHQLSRVQAIGLVRSHYRGARLYLADHLPRWFQAPLRWCVGLSLVFRLRLAVLSILLRRPRRLSQAGDRTGRPRRWRRRPGRGSRNRRS
ncbi:MAG: hypothetical protein LBJ44_09895 [Propionibacteriaceae bacterium]|jgi:N-acetylglucosaminyl-diphospho-decaprenol L-rhamnosyltransferase|nr:hypothetical protein [Propionibacteriaceae bacterium]